MKLNILTSLAVLACIPLIVITASHQRWSMWQTAGVVLLAASFLWIGVARWQLRDAFSVRAQATRLVTHGLYSRIRNPIYVGSPVFLLGLSLTLHRPALLLLILLVLPLQYFRARNEARVLHAAFGEAYERYRAQTWF